MFHNKGPTIKKSLLDVCSANSRPVPDHPLCTAPVPEITALVAGDSRAHAPSSLIACLTAFRTCPGCSAPSVENDGLRLGLGSRACKGGLCASSGFLLSGSGFPQVPYRPLFVQGLALYGRAVYS